MSDILKRRETHFVLWSPTPPATPPKLILGRIKNGNPATFDELVRKPLKQAVNGAGPIDGLWELDALSLGLADGETYHYWFEVDDTAPDRTTARVQTTDPLASVVDYRLVAPDNPAIIHPAAVIGWSGGKLVVRDPNGEHVTPVVADFDKLAANNRLVIYEMPTAWTRTSGSNEFERSVGTFRDVRALVEQRADAANFPTLEALRLDPPYLDQLGVNAVEFLPPADSVLAREWGYGTSHYLAADYELGYPEGHLSPTASADLTALINACHARGIRIFLDVVLGFMRQEPYRRVSFEALYLEHPERHKSDPDAYNSRDGGGKHLRNPYGGSCPRYTRLQTTYDPISGNVASVSPARQHMLTFLTRWMQDFQIDGIRIDSVENVANWDFIQAFKEAAREHFRLRYASRGAAADAKVLVVGEELSMPVELITQNRLDGLWNERFQELVRAALIGQNANNINFEETVRRAIDCRREGRFTDGAQAINYLTSHDVEGFRKERLYNFFHSNISVAESNPLFDRAAIERRFQDDIRNGGHNPFDPYWAEEIRKRTDGEILYRASLRRIKLAFVCQMTAVGIPMILAGEEFGDEHDLFNSQGNVTHEGGKQVDPVNYGRYEEPLRKELFRYVSRLVHLRTSHPALAVNDVKFIHVDFEEGKRVLVWQRGSDADPVVVVANFSNYTTPGAPGSGEYFTPNWPPTPPGRHWFEETQQRRPAPGRHDREPIFAWEAKVYRLLPGA